MKKYLLILFLGICFSAQAAASPPHERIITAGGSLTEIVYQLGLGDKVVGVDQSSTYPEAVKKVKSIGYWSTLSSEGILSLNPTMLITWQEAKPVNTIKQLQKAGIRVIQLDRVPATPTQLVTNIKTIAHAFNLDMEGEKLATAITSKLDAVTKKVAKEQNHPNVLFLFSMFGGPAEAAGRGTVADSLITLAGGKNVVNHKNYQIISAESFIVSDPDVIVLTTQGLDSLGGMEQLGKIQGLNQTKAWKNGRIVTFDQAILLGMGPRVGEAVAGLYNAFYPTSN
ncbi:ABC transporter substrate-binding protein [Orbaceae bacterium ESL0721]|nr:ABC transporter substrate-binding protein [Orbaceae bacterium ESL0721]